MVDTAEGAPKLALDLTERWGGVFVLESFVGISEGRHGLLATIALKLPKARAISHFAAFQRYDPWKSPAKESVGGGSNRVQGLRIRRWAAAIEGGLFAIMELSDGEWLALLPMVGPKSIAWLAPHENECGDRSELDEVQLKVGTLGTEPVEGDLPVLAWSRSSSVYEACAEVWCLALRHPLVRGSGRLREEKTFPEIFRYLGWCSWEQYKFAISSDVLVETARQINDCDLPVRFFLIDDGYHCHTGSGNFKKDQLVRFGPNPDLFPHGWQPLLKHRHEDGIRWFGLWQNHNGYWSRIAPENELGPELNTHLMDVPAGGRLPNPTLADSTVFYEALLEVARSGGFDFVKVDDQAQNLFNYRGTANAVRAARLSSQALERAAAGQVSGLLNCMAQGPVNAFNTCLSAVTRCSEDYQVNNAWRAKAHLHNSYQNMLWLGPTVWGDHDMFHSSDSFAGGMMAVSKAMSGGPVYLSDAPSDFNADIIRPLCDDDGRLYRPLSPAVPLPRCVTLNPFEQAEPYLVAAPLANGAAALVAYNLTEPEQAVSGRIVPQDYDDASGLLNTDDWPRLGTREGLVLYDWCTAEAFQLTESWEYTLTGFADRLLLLCPIINGWAVIGRTDKYLSPAAIAVRHSTLDSLILETNEACMVTIWRNGTLLRKKIPMGVYTWNA